MCGKNQRLSAISSSSSGSPPRVREKHNNGNLSTVSNRITPACAGKTFSELFIKPLSQDHPRVCGKNNIVAGCCKSIRGSPPRVREKPILGITKSNVLGITPACAGKTHASISVDIIHWDHPRVCGKNWCPYWLEETFLGSPPRVREKLEHLGFAKHLGRITPACAGKTSIEWDITVDIGDHPRVCGKNLLFFLLVASVIGSPPRVREKQSYEVIS